MEYTAHIAVKLYFFLQAIWATIPPLVWVTRCEQRERHLAGYVEIAELAGYLT